MPEPIDLYWSFRSPYSYLALKRLNDIEARRDVRFALHVVHPLAIRDPAFFDSRGPEWIAYLMRDVFRIAEMTDRTIAVPQPDPIVQDIMTAHIAAEQPYIHRLAYLGILATKNGQGMPFITATSQIIWSGKDWTEGTRLADAAALSGIDLPALEAQISGRETELDAELAKNDAALRKAGHWGVPTCVLRGEPFFGMDRLHALEWRLDRLGVA